MATCQPYQLQYSVLPPVDDEEDDAGRLDELLDTTLELEERLDDTLEEELLERLDELGARLLLELLREELEELTGTELLLPPPICTSIQPWKRS